MNGIHDMGGMQCFGPVQIDTSEVIFHASWEKSVLALTLAMGATGTWNIDESRSARESLPPKQYLNSSYYQIWFAALEKMLLERKLITQQELLTGQMQIPPSPISRVLKEDMVLPSLLRGTPSVRGLDTAPRFAIGQRVRAKNIQPSGHTRLPRYVRGKIGVIELNHGAHVLPDVHAQGNDPLHDQAEYLYTVVFQAQELWGSQADPHYVVSVDAWENYLELA